MGLLYLKLTNMTEYNRHQIIEITGISTSLYKQHLRVIKSSPRFSGFTYLKKVEYPNLNRKYQNVRYFRSSILDYFFHLKIKPRDKSDDKKYRSYSKTLKVDYTITLTPQMNKEDNIRITEIIKNDLFETYGKNLITYEYNVEYDPNNIHKGYYHTHLLLGFSCDTNYNEVKGHFTKYLEEKDGYSELVKMNQYYGTESSRGKMYFLKEGVVR
jgi:hypothetical protein